MIQIDVVHSGNLAHCTCAGQELTGNAPLPLIRQKGTALKIRFCTASGTADSAITAAMLAVPQIALTAGDKVRAVTEDLTVATGSDGCLTATASALVTDTESVRQYLSDHLTEAIEQGVPCTLEFSSRRNTGDTELSLWVAIPVRLFNPAKQSTTPDDEPETQANYLTAAATRTAIAETLDGYAQIQELSTANIIPHHGRIYAKTLAAGDTFRFTAPENTALQLTFELHLRQGTSAVSFSWGSSIWWMDAAGSCGADVQAPSFALANRYYALVFRFDGSHWIGNLAYSKAVND